MSSSQYDIARESDKIQHKLRMISEGIHHAEWPYLSSENHLDPTSFLHSMKELHFHIEACLTYVNALQEEQGLMVLNGY